MDDLELLKAYGDRRDQEAFAQLVRRHGAWLYGAARRQLGDGHSAEDATQAVFLLLAGRAKELRRYRYLDGWLFLALGYCIRNIRQQRSRRARREQEAAAMRPERIEPEARWDEVAPMVEAAVGRLGAKDRDAVLLRFYERRSLAEVGRLLGVSEEAARKRVERAVERLREILAARGVETVGLSGMLLTHAVPPGPAGLTESIMASIGHGVGSGAAGAIAKGATKMMVLAKVKVAVVLIAVGASAGAVALSQVPPAVPQGSAVKTTTKPTAARRVSGEYYIGGNVPRVGVYSVSGRSVTVLQALVAAGADVASSTSQSVDVIRRIRGAKGVSETFYVLSVDDLVRGSADLLLQPDDVVQVRPTQNWIERPAGPVEWSGYYISGVDRTGVYSTGGQTITIRAALISAGYNADRGEHVTVCRRKADGPAEILHWKADDLLGGAAKDVLAEPGDVIMVGQKAPEDQRK